MDYNCKLFNENSIYSEKRNEGSEIIIRSVTGFIQG
jgi:hypothetical protein